MTWEIFGQFLSLWIVAMLAWFLGSLVGSVIGGLAARWWFRTRR